MAHTTHNTHLTYTSQLEADYVSEAERLSHKTDTNSDNTCPGAFGARVDPWLWLNILVSLCALAAILASESLGFGLGPGNHWVVFLLTLAASAISSGDGETTTTSTKATTTTTQTRMKAQAFEAPKAVGGVGLDRATAVTITVLVLAGLFYTSILLVLSRRERRLAEQARKPSSSPTATTDSKNPMDPTECPELAPLDTLEDAADSSSHAAARENVVFLILVVCQNAMVALFLYVGIRMMFIVKSIIMTTLDESELLECGESAFCGWYLYVYLELGYMVAQAALMFGVVFQCALQVDKLGQYMRTRQRVVSLEEKLGWVDREEEEAAPEYA